MIAFLIVLGWLICSVLAYLLGKFLWIRDMKSTLHFLPVWSEEDRLIFILVSIIFGPLGLTLLLLAFFGEIIKHFVGKVIGCSSNKPAKW